MNNNLIIFFDVLPQISIIGLLIQCLGLCIPLLIGVAYFTLAERKIIAAIQRRRGPNVIGYYGLLQPLADGLKLALKEILCPSNAETALFYFAPLLTFFLSLVSWAVIPFSLYAVFADIPGFAEIDFLFNIILSMGKSCHSLRRKRRSLDRLQKQSKLKKIKLDNTDIRWNSWYQDSKGVYTCRCRVGAAYNYNYPDKKEELKLRLHEKVIQSYDPFPPILLENMRLYQDYDIRICADINVSMRGTMALANNSMNYRGEKSTWVLGNLPLQISPAFYHAETLEGLQKILDKTLPHVDQIIFDTLIFHVVEVTVIGSKRAEKKDLHKYTL